MRAAAPIVALLVLASAPVAPGFRDGPVLHAQGTPGDALRAGDRIEVVSPAVVNWEAKGRLLSLDGDTLTLVPDGGGSALRLSVGDVERLRVHRGYGDARWRGVILGAPLGFAAGSMLNDARQPVGRTLQTSWQLGGAVAGAVVGWVVGYFLPVDDWVEITPAPPPPPADSSASGR